MDKSVINDKLISLKRCIERIETKIPDNKDDFVKSYDLQDIISLNLQRAIQISVDIASHILSQLDSEVPSTMAESFLKLRKSHIISENIYETLKKSIGFRNIAVHEYSELNWDIVFSVVTTGLSVFRRYAYEIVSWLEKQE